MIVVLGASGMLGHALHRVLSERGFDVVGTVRGAVPDHPSVRALRFRPGIDIADFPSIRQAMCEFKPSVVINAAGIIKQIEASGNTSAMFAINGVAPHRIEILAKQSGFRVIQFSTDCVFSGNRGKYLESDIPDAVDAYGHSKFLGELYEPHCLTLRTSIIGHGLVPNASLIDWFLAQSGHVRCFRRAVFSGLPVNEIGDIVSDFILTSRLPLSGLRHLSADPISKHDLLVLVREVWRRHDIRVVADENLEIDRSLNSDVFRAETGFRPAPWPILIERMHKFYEGYRR